MNCIDDAPNGIILNHNSDWSGKVRIAWYVVNERRDPGPIPTSLQESWCDGPDLIAGRYSPVNAPDGEASHDDPPLRVLTRAVALAVETFLRSKMESAVDKLFIKRSKL
jgi:hypothetical protein